MISLCTVVKENHRNYLKIFCESVIENFKIVNEVLIMNVDQDTTYKESWEEKNIRFEVRGAKMDHFFVGCATSYCAQHALALHEAINIAKNEYVLLSDPDIFFYTSIDEFYLSLIKKYNLNIIGMSHSMAINESCTYFPNVLNFMAKKSDLPPNDYMLNLKFDGGKGTVIPKHENLESRIIAKWLFPNTPKEKEHLFPKPDGDWETGCNLFLWSQENNWRWLSFQTTDCFLYTTQYYRANFKITDKIPKIKLLYHTVNSATQPKNYQRFVDEYKNYQLKSCAIG